MNLHYIDDESYLYVNKTEICKCKVNNNRSWYNFSIGSVSKIFTKDQQSEVFIKRYCICNGSVDHSSIKKEDILNIHQYFMAINNTCLSFLANICGIINYQN